MSTPSQSPTHEQLNGRRDATRRPPQSSDVRQLLWRGAPFALFVAVVAVVGAIAFTRLSAPVYEANVTLVVARNAVSFGGLDLVVPPAVDPTVYRTALFESDVLVEALELVDGERYGQEALRDAAQAIRVSIESQEASGLVRIAVRDASPERAAAIANTLAGRLVAWDQERAREGLDQGVAALERALAELDAQIARVNAGASSASADLDTLRALRSQGQAELERVRALSATAVAVSRLEPMRTASPPERAVNARMSLNASIAGIFGLLLAYGLLFVGGWAKPRVRDAASIAQDLGLPVLARFPRRFRDSPRLSNEAASLLRVRLEQQRSSPEALVVVVAGVGRAEEKDGVAVGLAESFTLGGSKALLLDADLRNALATAWLKVGPTRESLFDNALGKPRRDVPPIAVALEGERTFDFQPACRGEQQPVERIARVLRDHTSAWKDAYEVVIVDTAPVLGHADALMVAASVQGVAVLCAAVGRAESADLAEARDRLEQTGVPVLGVVLTNAAPPERRPAATRAGRGAATRARVLSGVRRS